MALTDKLSAIADSIREKTGKADLLTLDQMPAEIGTIGGLPEEALVITGDCQYKFAYDGWNWFIEKLGNQITTKDITDCKYMFYSSTALTNIPFEINCQPENLSTMANMFEDCKSLTSIPKIYNCKPYSFNSIFKNCYRLKELPSDLGDWFDWSYIQSETSTYGGVASNLFSGCYSLRSIPINSLKYCGGLNTRYNSSLYYYGFFSCYSLDEIVDLPIPHINATWTSNAFSNTFGSCNHLKNMTFALQEDGSPYVVKWKSQTIDLTNYVGYTNNVLNMVGYNSGLDESFNITDDTLYRESETLGAGGHDYWTSKIEYSRYNHDSAVATINSLPDTSAYLATAGGTNTIKFNGASGAKTDGGAINTLTEEEIAVAAAKGWTVTFA